MHPPVCSSENTLASTAVCQLDGAKAVFLAVYLSIGVPLFSLTLGQFSGLLVEKAVRAGEMNKMSKPLSDDELAFASRLHTGSGKDNDEINFADFVITELYRLKRVDGDELLQMRQLFEKLDNKKTGFVDKNVLKRTHEGPATFSNSQENKW